MLRDKIKEIFAKPFSDIDKIVCLETLVQDEINRLKAQHAEEIGKLETQVKTGIDLQTILVNTVEIERNTHNGYRQAVKDILGGENND